MKGQNKKDEILNAAKECFSRYGYDKTTLEDIGRAAKLNKASLYYYFKKGKEDIFMQVVLSESKTYNQNLREKVTKIDNNREKIIQYLLERFNYYGETLNVHQLSVANVSKLQPIFDELYQNILQEEVAFLTTLVDQLATDTDYHIDDSHFIAKLLIALCNAFKHETIRTSKAVFANEVDYSEAYILVENITNLVLNGLKKNN